MNDRPFWKARIAALFEQVGIVWLSGVRRIGKTTLASSIPGALVLNCDLPSTARRLEDPEQFFESIDAETLVLDEIHQLPDPSKVLKIAADAFPKLKIIATGSSTLAATQRFRDSLTGRKRALHLLPVLVSECPCFGVADLRRRLLHGGLPAHLLSMKPDAESFGEWLDSYFARDIQELFRVGNRSAFLKLVELLMRSSGGMAEVTKLASLSGASRPTVMTYLDALAVTHAITILRPFHGGGRQEIVRQPKIYVFDTGFVGWANGWDSLREHECGLLWEHVVLETLAAVTPEKDIHFWRDKRKHEIDFVIHRQRDSCDAIECKWDPAAFQVDSLQAFRELHPRGCNFVITPKPGKPYVRTYASLEVTYTNLPDWQAAHAGSGGS